MSSARESVPRFVAGAIFIVVVVVAVQWEGCRSGRVGLLWQNLAAPGSGEKEVLPKSVHRLLGFVREKRATTLSLSPDLAANRFFAQPITEGVYPIIVKDGAPLRVSFSQEALPAGYVSLWNQEGLRVAVRR